MTVRGLGSGTLVLAVSLAGFLLGAADARAQWQAGAATENITPQQLMWMSGYGARDRPAQGKQTDLWAKALALTDPSGNTIVLVTMDLVGIDRGLSQRVAKQAEQRFGLARSQLALSTTHTHSGPVVGENLAAMYSFNDQQAKLVRDYAARLESQLVELIGRSLENRQPARLSWGEGMATFAVNRRNNPEAEGPQLREQGKLVGPADYAVPVLAVRDSEDELKAIVCGYACHATVLSDYEWSGDWPGYAQIALEEKYPGAVAMVWAGCGADQNPIPRRGVELAQQYGAELADAVGEVLAGVTQPIEGSLAHHYAEIEISFASLPTREQLESTAATGEGAEAGRARHLLAQWDRQGELSAVYPYPVQVWQLGRNGPAFVLLGGEVVVDYALRLKAEIGPATWVAGYANDVMAYIPSRRVLGEGGYEGGGAMVYYGQPSPWMPEVEEKIVGEVRRQVEGVRRAVRGVE
ncbi:MAG: neutral/alkaline non-lysosomal ceramidase N-terminal domain-containing protein [Pirellulales bacterium]